VREAVLFKCGQKWLLLKINGLNDAHESSMCFSPLLTTAAAGNFSCHNKAAYIPFGMIICEGDILVN
jgi:hypothetical protein